MSVFAMGVVAMVGLLHLFIAWFEMFAWERLGPKIFVTLPRDSFAGTRLLAANQGLYNGFLAAGLFWALLIPDPVWSVRVAVYFLVCVAVAGIYGAMTVSPRILRVQTVPAAVALGLVWLG